MKSLNWKLLKENKSELNDLANESGVELNVFLREAFLKGFDENITDCKNERDILFPKKSPSKSLQFDANNTQILKEEARKLKIDAGRFIEYAIICGINEAREYFKSSNVKNPPETFQIPLREDVNELLLKEAKDAHVYTTVFARTAALFGRKYVKKYLSGEHKHDLKEEGFYRYYDRNSSYYEDSSFNVGGDYHWRIVRLKEEYKSNGYLFTTFFILKGIEKAVKHFKKLKEDLKNESVHKNNSNGIKESNYDHLREFFRLEARR